MGPMIKEAEQKGREEGRQEGREEGRQEGRQKGELIVLRRQIEKRFGPLPKWAGEKLAALSLSELEDLCERLLDSNSLEDLLK